MGSYRDSISGIGIHVKSKERLPYGDKDRGKFVPSEKGRRSIFVPSWGTMEKEEVEEVVLAAQEQEDERLKKGYKSEVKETVENLTRAAMQAPRGKRKKTIEGLVDEGKNKWI